MDRYVPVIVAAVPQLPACVGVPRSEPLGLELGPTLATQRVIKPEVELM